MTLDETSPQLTEEQALDLFKSDFWKTLTLKQRARLQAIQGRLFMPFAVFHEAVEKTLGRPVYTHEFGLNWNGIKAELFDGDAAPTMEEIENLIPFEKRLIVEVREP